MNESIIERVHKEKIIAIIRGCEPSICISLAKALYKGGITMIEVTFNQNDPQSFNKTTEAIQSIAKYFEGKVLVGAGTVLTKEQVNLAARAGAKYIISPNVNKDVIEYTKQLGLVSMPGAFSASEICQAYELGADFVKVFPVANLGSQYIKALKAPLSHIPLLAVGGVNKDNIKDFLNAGAVGVGVGGKLVDKNLIEKKEFDKITSLAKEYILNAK
ncbi:bifunctional 4-hydroxy-2-oxoglutarate aldolase/2-dehydro-3-deoxy-phosphogluconate aldolase [Clostridium oceanicum]|uniref:Bifunctional 4-hydroxy-2-oxoglutarate aldolase/2-dehydro-3-deoxy-phosphogluconate aldolase n=1 Tax=Clostridium oceanicum TaxID=1543 RepID=A0ABP3UGV8_9CLOT